MTLLHRSWEIIHEALLEIQKDVSIVMDYSYQTLYPLLLPYLNYSSEQFDIYLRSYKKSKFRSRAHQLLLAASKSEHKLLIVATVVTILALIFTCMLFRTVGKPKKKPLEIVSNKRQVAFASDHNDRKTPKTPIIMRDEEDDIIYSSPRSRMSDMSKEQEEAYQLITSGVVLIKHGRLGTRHIRYVAVSEDLTHICWRPLGAFNEMNTLPLSSFKRYSVMIVNTTLMLAIQY